MNRKIVVALLAIVVASMSLISASAHTTVPLAVGSHAQEAEKCADATFLTELGKDMTDLGATFKTTKMDDAASMAQSLIAIAATRQKYEDMTGVASECFSTQLAAIIAFANASDLLALGMAVKADPTNAETYAKTMKDQLDRFTKSVNQVLTEAGGAATPAASS
jgi:signal transduction histidine kinase